MAKIILTGASGYFGSLAKQYLKNLGHQVITAGRTKSSDLCFDLDKPDAFAASAYSNADVFIHAAAVNEVECQEQPYQTIYRNVAGTRAALDFCVKNNIGRFIYLSTFHVYGKDTGLINEETPAEPLHDYGLTHLQAEEYVQMYTRKGLIKGVSLRPSNMFDVPADIDSFNRWSLIPFGFCKDAVKKGQIELKSSGYQQRNFVSAFDIVRVVQMILDEKIQKEVINVPGMDTLSIRKFANLVANQVRNEFGNNVDVIIPDTDGGTLNHSLQYSSKIVNPSSLEFSRIEYFISKFCKVLSQ